MLKVDPFGQLCHFSDHFWMKIQSRKTVHTSSLVNIGYEIT
jgi:hypothetical protein